MIGREESPLVRTIIWFRPVLKAGTSCTRYPGSDAIPELCHKVVPKQPELSRANRLLCKQLHFGATNEKEFGGQETAVVEIRAARLGDVS